MLSVVRRTFSRVRWYDWAAIAVAAFVAQSFILGFVLGRLYARGVWGAHASAGARLIGLPAVGRQTELGVSGRTSSVPRPLPRGPALRSS